MYEPLLIKTKCVSTLYDKYNGICAIIQSVLGLPMIQELAGSHLTKGETYKFEPISCVATT